MAALSVFSDHQEKIRKGEFHGSREEWCEAIAAQLIPRLASIGIEFIGEPREIRFAIAPLAAAVLGVCYASSKSVDGNVNLITINSNCGDYLELVRTLIHEILHAADDCKSGHRGRWKRNADLIGISRTGHDRDGLAEQLCQQALEAVGIPVKHRQTQSRSSKKPPSQVRCECPECGLHVHMATSKAVAGFTVTCTFCEVVMDADLSYFTSWGEQDQTQHETPEPDQAANEDVSQYTIAQCRSEMQKWHPDKLPKDADEETTRYHSEQFQIWLERYERLRQAEKARKQAEQDQPQAEAA